MAGVRTLQVGITLKKTLENRDICTRVRTTSHLSILLSTVLVGWILRLECDGAVPLLWLGFKVERHIGHDHIGRRRLLAVRSTFVGPSVGKQPSMELMYKILALTGWQSQLIWRVGTLEREDRLQTPQPLRAPLISPPQP